MSNPSANHANKWFIGYSWNFFLFLVSVFLCSIAYSLVFWYLPLYLTEIGGPLLFGEVYTLGLVVNLLAVYFGGALTDVFGRKPILLASGFLMFLGVLLLGLSSVLSFSVLAPISALILQSSGIGVSTLVAYVAENVVEVSKQGLAYSFFRMTLILSSVTLSVLFSLEEKTTLLIIIVLSFSGSLMRFSLKETMISKKKLVLTQLIPDIRLLKPRPGLLYSLILAPLAYFNFVLSPYLELTLGVSIESIALLYALISVIPLFSSPVAGFLIGQIGPTRFLVATSFIYSLPMLLFMLANDPLSVSVLVLIGVAIFDAIQVSLNAYLARVTNRNNRGTINSIRLFYWITLSIPGPLIGGVILNFSARLLALPIVFGSILYASLLFLSSRREPDEG